MEYYVSERIFDGAVIRPGALSVGGGRVRGIVSRTDIPGGATAIDLGPGLIAPGFVDLQVNGGGGLMFNDAPDVVTLRRIAGAHARLGTTALFPTLITDSPEITRQAVLAVEEARAAGVPGIAGLHLEGPFLNPLRKGAHEAGLIRRFGADDLEFLTDAKRRVGALMVTVAPEIVGADAIRALSRAGILVSLGHSEATCAEARAAAGAGARAVTHLFNAMSQLQAREPGLVGAALAEGRLSAGLIADGIHVHPVAIRAALAAKAGPGRIFLVTDAMAVAGTDLEGFRLNGRRIRRQGGRLTLEDGTLAGADLDFPRAIRVMCGDVGVPLVTALGMATAVPAAVAGLDGAGALRPGGPADFVHLDAGLALTGVWRGGLRIGGD